MNYIFIAGALVAGILAIKFSKSKNSSMSALFALVGVALAVIFIYMTYFSASPIQVLQTLSSAEGYGAAELIKKEAPDTKVVLVSWGDAQNDVNLEIIEALKANGVRNVEFVASMSGPPIGIRPEESMRMFLEAVKDVQDGDTVYVRSLKLNSAALNAFFKKNPKSKVLLYVNTEDIELGRIPGVIGQIRTHPNAVQENLPSDPKKAFEQGFMLIE